MKTLVVYYSRTGVTHQVATELAERLGADVEELQDTKSRSGKLGYIAAGKDAALRKAVPIAPPSHDPGDYEMVVVGTPVWANTMCTAVRTYLTDAAGNISRLAVFCTTRTSGIDKTLAEMERVAACDATATAGFRQKDVKAGSHKTELERFASQIEPGEKSPS